MKKYSPTSHVGKFLQRSYLNDETPFKSFFDRMKKIHADDLGILEKLDMELRDVDIALEVYEVIISSTEATYKLREKSSERERQAKTLGLTVTKLKEIERTIHELKSACHRLEAHEASIAEVQKKINAAQRSIAEEAQQESLNTKAISELGRTHKKLKDEHTKKCNNNNRKLWIQKRDEYEKLMKTLQACHAHLTQFKAHVIYNLETNSDREDMLARQVFQFKFDAAVAQHAQRTFRKEQVKHQIKDTVDGKPIYYSWTRMTKDRDFKVTVRKQEKGYLSNAYASLAKEALGYFYDAYASDPLLQSALKGSFNTDFAETILSKELEDYENLRENIDLEDARNELGRVKGYVARAQELNEDTFPFICYYRAPGDTHFTPLSFNFLVQNGITSLDLLRDYVVLGKLEEIISSHQLFDEDQADTLRSEYAQKRVQLTNTSTN